MKKFLLVLCSLMGCVALQAATATVNGITWTYKVVNGEATISTGGWFPAIPSSTSGAITIPSTLGGYHVTSIGDFAFFRCSRLTSVKIPLSVTTIGSHAFSDCTNLWKDANDVQYESEAKVVLIDVPESLAEELVIPNTVRFIHSAAFRDCKSLTSVTIPYSVTSIGNSAFYGCYGLTSMTIPSSVTSIGYCAFEDCSSLTSVTIPEGVTTIESSTFYGCYGLTSVTIPSSVTTIRDSAFYNCSITSVTIPKGVTAIEASALEGCTNLTSVTIPESVVEIGRWAFYNCSSLSSVTIPSSVTSIGDSAFSGCYGLTSVTIPEGVTEIGNSAFSGCSNLTSVTIPEGVTTIGEWAFSYCPSLTSVTIPSSVTEIGNSAFSGCSSLTSADFKGKPPSVGSYAFYNISSSATGTYLPKYASEWKAVLDAQGKWNGLTMVQKAVATSPEGLPDATGEWLARMLEDARITSESVTLAEGTSAASLESARLLGITPNVTRTDDGATVAAESSFEVSEVVVADNAVALAVTITVEAGELPENPSLGDVVKLLACDTLGVIGGRQLQLLRKSCLHALVTPKQRFLSHKRLMPTNSLRRS